MSCGAFLTILIGISRDHFGGARDGASHGSPSSFHVSRKPLRVRVRCDWRCPERRRQMHFPPRGVAVRGAMSTIAAVASAAGGPSCYYLITDFDGTCTQKDTTPLVPHLAARSSSTPDEVLERFNALEDLYMSMVESVHNGMALHRCD